MTSSNTRSSRTKKPTSNNIIGDKTKNIKKTKKQLRSKRDNSHHNNTTTPTANNDNQLWFLVIKWIKLTFDSRSQQEVYDLTNKYIDPSEHPDYNRLMNELEESKQKKLEKIKIWRDHEKTSVLDWFTAQKKQAWDDYYVRSNWVLYSYSFFCSLLVKEQGLYLLKKYRQKCRN